MTDAVSGRPWTHPASEPPTDPAVARARQQQPPQSEERAEEQDARYTIDELAAKTGVPSRTIRFYQAKGALPPPQRQGRVAYYDETHVERLELVAQLQDRGLNLRAIRDLLQNAERQNISVSQWLGLGEKLRTPWLEDRPQLYSEEQLGELLGDSARPGLVGELLEVGLMRREGRAQPPSYLVESPRLLQIALKLDAAGVDLESAHKAEEIIRDKLSRTADDLVDFFIERLQQRDPEKTPDELGRSFDALRQLGVEAVEIVFAQEVERALQSFFEHGRASRNNRSKKGRRRSS